MTGLHYDRAVIERRLVHLLESVEVLKELSQEPLEYFQSDRRARWGLERGLQTCIQAVLDIAGHITATSGRTVPDEYKAGILALADMGVLPRDFANRIAPMAGLRNILVHEYLEVDLEVLKAILTERLNDFVEFSVYIEDHLTQREAINGSNCA